MSGHGASLGADDRLAASSIMTCAAPMPRQVWQAQPAITSAEGQFPGNVSSSRHAFNSSTSIFLVVAALEELRTALIDASKAHQRSYQEDLADDGGGSCSTGNATSTFLCFSVDFLTLVNNASAPTDFRGLDLAPVRVEVYQNWPRWRLFPPSLTSPFEFQFGLLHPSSCIGDIISCLLSLSSLATISPRHMQQERSQIRAATSLVS